MKKFLLFLVIAFSGILFACNKDNDDNRNQVEIPEGYSLLWADEFDGSDLNTEYWQLNRGWDGLWFACRLGK